MDNINQAPQEPRSTNPGPLSGKSIRALIWILLGSAGILYAYNVFKMYNGTFPQNAGASLLPSGFVATCFLLYGLKIFENRKREESIILPILAGVIFLLTIVNYFQIY